MTSEIEHMSVLKCFDRMHHFSYGITPVNKDGLVDIANMQYLCNRLIMQNPPDAKLSLVSVMTGNNEIGTVQPIREVKKFCEQNGALFHTDAVQAAGRVKLSVDDADMITLSSHKMYGPKGAGAIYVSDKAKEMIRPQIHGGYQETFTSGTSNVPAIVGFGKAAELMVLEGPEENVRLAGLRDRFLCLLKERIDGITVNGSMKHRLPHNLNISIDGIDAEALTNIDGLCVSTGSACKKTGSLKLSHVIKAIGADKNSVRFGFGRFNTDTDIEIAADKIIKMVEVLR
jgi:cysteine desulfurase